MDKKPEWLKIKVKNTKEKDEVFELLEKLSLHTVCEEAACPNLMECYGRRTATFMIMGRNCSRNCTFCNVTKACPTPLDQNEPAHVAEAVEKLGLRHVVITSVTRDDLADGGSGHFAKVINEIKKRTPKVIIEVLIPDFKGDDDALKTVVDAHPHVINHNVETVPRLYSEVRPMAVYERSLRLLKRAKEMDSTIITKSGIMLGLAEKEEEVISLFKDLLDNNCTALTIGQYLAPSKEHHPVMEYVTPEQFEKYKQTALSMGFEFVASSPLVRSSYHADMIDSLIQ